MNPERRGAWGEVVAVEGGVGERRDVGERGPSWPAPGAWRVALLLKPYASDSFSASGLTHAATMGTPCQRFRVGDQGDDALRVEEPGELRLRSRRAVRGPLGHRLPGQQSVGVLRPHARVGSLRAVAVVGRGLRRVAGCPAASWWTSRHCARAGPSASCSSPGSSPPSGVSSPWWRCRSRCTTSPGPRSKSAWSAWPSSCPSSSARSSVARSATQSTGARSWPSRASCSASPVQPWPSTRWAGTPCSGCSTWCRPWRPGSTASRGRRASPPSRCCSPPGTSSPRTRSPRWSSRSAPWSARRSRAC